MQRNTNRAPSSATVRPADPCSAASRRPQHVPCRPPPPSPIPTASCCRILRFVQKDVDSKEIRLSLSRVGVMTAAFSPDTPISFGADW
ncbi:hypothetical protein J6590_061847 [Homalodisca vitripennis]|nr:hypothetical protein J6590_061847 [Homalodisca vitripennis]